MVKAIAAVLLAVLLMRLGLAVLRALARPVPEPPPSGELRKVNLRYRCGVCGTELRMTAAPDEAPAPPRHCLEDMELVSPVD